MKFCSISNSKWSYFLEIVLVKKFQIFGKKRTLYIFGKFSKHQPFCQNVCIYQIFDSKSKKIVIRSSEKRYAMAISCRVVRGSDWRHNMPLENNIIIGVGVLPTSLKIKNFEIFWDFNALIKLACFLAITFGYITLVVVTLGNFGENWQFWWKIVENSLICFLWHGPLNKTDKLWAELRGIGLRL